MIFWLFSWFEDFAIWRAPLRFSVTVDDVVVVCCEVVGVGLVDLGVMVLELDSSFGGCFGLELGGVGEWTSGGLISMVVIGSF